MLEDKEMIQLSNILLKACVIGDAKQVQDIYNQRTEVEWNAEIRKGNWCDSINALHVAASCGHRDVVKLLIKQYGISVNVEDAQCMTPLHHALAHHHAHVATFLLKKGAGGLERDKYGNTVYDYAALTNNKLLMHYIGSMVTDSNGDNFLHKAVRNNDYGLCKKLLEYGAVDVKNKQGKTPLYYACKLKNNEIIQLLLFFGASPRALSSSSSFKDKIIFTGDENIGIMKLLLGVIPEKKLKITIRDLQILLVARADKLLTLLLHDTDVGVMLVNSVKDISKTFLKKCLSINPQLAFTCDAQGRPALLVKAFQMQRWDIVILLLKQGVRDEEVMQQYKHWFWKLLEYNDQELISKIASESNEFAEQLKQFKENYSIVLRLKRIDVEHACSLVAKLTQNRINTEIIVRSDVLRLVGSSDNVAELIRTAYFVQDSLDQDYFLDLATDPKRIFLCEKSKQSAVQ